MLRNTLYLTIHSVLRVSLPFYHLILTQLREDTPFLLSFVVQVTSLSTALCVWGAWKRLSSRCSRFTVHPLSSWHFGILFFLCQISETSIWLGIGYLFFFKVYKINKWVREVDVTLKPVCGRFLFIVSSMHKRIVYAKNRWSTGGKQWNKLLQHGCLS